MHANEINLQYREPRPQTLLFSLDRLNRGLSSFTTARYMYAKFQVQTMQVLDNPISGATNTAIAAGAYD